MIKKVFLVNHLKADFARDVCLGTEEGTDQWVSFRSVGLHLDRLIYTAMLDTETLADVVNLHVAFDFGIPRLHMSQDQMIISNLNSHLQL